MNKLLTLLFLLISVFANAQKGTNTFTISYGQGNGQIKPILSVAKMSGQYAKGDVSLFGFNYLIGTGKRNAIETGIIIQKHDFVYSDFSNPPNTIVTNNTNTSVILPLKLRFNILKYFFISGGMLADISLSGEAHNLGLGIGAGVQYYYKNKYGIFVYPQANIHTIGIGLAESHVTAGFAYRFQKK